MVFVVAAPFLKYQLAVAVVFTVAGVPPAANFTILLLTNLLASDISSLHSKIITVIQEIENLTLGHL